MRPGFKYTLLNINGSFISKLEADETDAKLIADRLIRRGIVLESYDGEIKIFPVGDAGFHVVTDAGQYLLTREKTAIRE